MIRKRYTLGLVIALIVLVTPASVALAQGPNWGGGGLIVEAWHILLSLIGTFLF